MAPTRIAFAITELDAGGAERTLANLVLGLDRAEWEPRVYCLAPWGPYASVLQDGGVPVRCLDAVHIWDAPRIFWRLRRELRAFRPEILQTFLFHANILGRLAGRAAGVPHVVSGIRVAERRSRIYGWIDRATNWLVERNVCVSQGVAEFCERIVGLSPAKTVVIPNGIDANPFLAADPVQWSDLGLPADAQVFLAIGRLEPQKGFDVLLDAACEFLPACPGTHLVLVGEGPDRAELERRATQEPLAGRVWLLGRRRDVPRLLRAARALVLSSRWEGMPNVILEAMAAGRPVIATAVEGTAELVRDGETGLVVPVGNPGALAAAVRRLAGDPAFAASLGRNAQDVCNKSFTVTSMVAAYVGLYRALVAAPPAARS